MHPVNYLFEEINRAHWGMTLGADVRCSDEDRAAAKRRADLRGSAKRA